MMPKGVAIPPELLPSGIQLKKLSAEWGESDVDIFRMRQYRLVAYCAERRAIQYQPLVLKALECHESVYER
jgi:hypothetical protein